MKKKRIIVLVLSFVLIFSSSFAYGHSGGLDSNGGHRDNKNKSGLGYYHYHCWGYGPHLHPNGYCPYTSDGSYSNSGSSGSTASASISSTPASKIQLKQPVATVKGYKSYIKVSWREVNHATKYCVYRSTNKNGTYTKIATTTNLSYKDKTAKVGTKYYYKVKAFGTGRYTKSYYSKPKSGKRTVLVPDIELDYDSVRIEPGESKYIYAYVENSEDNIWVSWYADWLEVEFTDYFKEEGLDVHEIKLTCAKDSPWAGEVDTLEFSLNEDGSNPLASLEVMHE